MGRYLGFNSAMGEYLLLNLVLISIACCRGQDFGCAEMDMGNGNIVCVCNATYCDTLQPLTKLVPGQYWTVTSSGQGQRFEKQQSNFLEHGFSSEAEDMTLTLNHDIKNQTIMGFGGAFTDASSGLIMNLSEATRDNLLRSYFSIDGIEYTFGRVPIGGCDFSPRIYTYDDGYPDDFELVHFTLAPEDLQLKIPVIQMALAMTQRPIRMFASPWSAPAWMKINENITGQGSLKGEAGGQYYQTWADYYVKFLDEYGKQGISFWGVTAQNEPLDGNMPDFGFNCMGYTAETQRVFIGQNLGPTLASSGYGQVSILMLDDQRLLLPQWAQEVLRNDSTTRDYVAGIAFHWYLNFVVQSSVLTQTHDLFPDKFLLSTEASAGSEPFQSAVAPGAWDRAEDYASDILDDLLHWTTGWVDWNICLDETGGPNWNEGGVDSPIIVVAQSDEFYKNPMFYALGHFSKFVPLDSVVIDTQSSSVDPEVTFISFDAPDGSTVVVILSTSDASRSVLIQDPNVGSFSVQLPPHSIQTYVWWSA